MIQPVLLLRLRRVAVFECSVMAELARAVSSNVVDGSVKWHDHGSD